MEITFGIITNDGTTDLIKSTIKDIERLEVPKYEIIVVGGNHISHNKVIHVPFDDTIKKSWITRKKNMITERARYENIVYTHDYITFDKDWYSGFKQFGNDFEICMTKIINADGTRFRDWLIWPHNNNEMDSIIARQRGCMIPYSLTHLSKYMYISGVYWVAKKHIMEKYPLDESLCWGESEDVVWSKQVRQEHDFKINPLSSVKMRKYKDKIFNEADDKTLEQILELEPKP
jgi:hypothetical protein